MEYRSKDVAETSVNICPKALLLVLRNVEAAMIRNVKEMVVCAECYQVMPLWTPARSPRLSTTGELGKRIQSNKGRSCDNQQPDDTIPGARSEASWS